MPRKKTYWKNPERYRKQSRDYSKAQYVPRKKSLNTKTTFGNSVTNKIGNNTKTKSNSSKALDEIKCILEKHYSKRYVAAKIRKMHQLNQVFVCQGFAFMTISIYLQWYNAKMFAHLPKSSQKGQQGLINIIPQLQKWFPSPKYMIFLNPVDQKGIDILVLKNGTPYTAIELTNYAKTSYLNSKEVRRYINNLQYWTNFYKGIHMVIIVNYRENLKINPRWKNAYAHIVANKIRIKVLK